jgi:hypothetical protein
VGCALVSLSVRPSCTSYSPRAEVIRSSCDSSAGMAAPLPGCRCVAPRGVPPRVVWCITRHKCSRWRLSKRNGRRELGARRSGNSWRGRDDGPERRWANPEELSLKRAGGCTGAAHAALPALRQGAAPEVVVQAEAQVPGVRAAVGPGGGGLLPGRASCSTTSSAGSSSWPWWCCSCLHLADVPVGLPAVGRDRVHRHPPFLFYRFRSPPGSRRTS